MKGGNYSRKYGRLEISQIKCGQAALNELYHLRICVTTRNCSTLWTLFVFLVIFTASQLHLAIMGHLIQGILLLNALGIIICVSSDIDMRCKKKLKNQKQSFFNSKDTKIDT